MNRSRAARCLTCFVLLFTVLGGLLGASVVFAAGEDASGSVSPPPGQEEPPPKAPVNIANKFPTLEGIASDIFEFEIMLEPSAEEYAVKYDFNIIAPPGWETEIWSSYPQKRVSSIDFTAERVIAEEITVNAFATPGKSPEPGLYVITLEMESEAGDLKTSIDLTAKVTASYTFGIYTETGRLSAEAKSGEDNHISIFLLNEGTADVEDISLSATGPEGWSITFDPNKIDSLEPNLKRQVDVVVNPPERTIAGDYPITLKANSERGADSLEMRVTVLTSTMWGWAGIGIAAGVIAGLIIMFRRLGRR